MLSVASAEVPFKRDELVYASLEESRLLSQNVLKQLVSLTTAMEKLAAAVAEGIGRVGAESGPGPAPRG